MNATMEAKTELQALLDTALRVKNEGLEDRFDMCTWGEVRDCGTVACLAGWHCHFNGTWDEYAMGSTLPVGKYLWEPEEEAQRIAAVLAPASDDHQRHIAHRVLFGSHRAMSTNSKTLNRQIRAIRWFLHRIEALEEYERIRAMPRKERRRLKVAA